jgi:succinate dehydrogenase/fumarate reductase flavoprotein subunit
MVMKRKATKPDLTRRDFIKTTVGTVGATAVVGLGTQAVKAAVPRWDRVADVVVIGAGAAGLPAAIRARDRGASVILIESNTDIGGHAMLSGGSVALGGGTSLQKKFGIVDSPDEVYLDLTSADHPMMRYSDRKVVRAFANINVAAFDFLIENGVQFFEGRPNHLAAEGVRTARRQTTKRSSDDLKDTINGSGGSGLVRALEKSARAKGVDILLQHKMTTIVRAEPRSGRVLGITTTNLRDNTTINIQARKAVIGCTGGSSSNVFVRTIYDPRLTEEYHAGGEPYSLQSGDTEQLGLAIGASLGSTANARSERFVNIQKAVWIGCRDGYMSWNPNGPRFPLAGASGISVGDYQDAILVNLVGRRFYNELASMRLSESDGGRAVHDYFAAASSSAVLEGPTGKERVGGPIWAIFDADAVKREKWDLRPPFVDIENGYFFSADTLPELAGHVSKNRHQKVPMPPAALQETVARYNAFVDSGTDTDFGKPTPKYKIQTPPFCAAYATPMLHDCLAGLRVNEKCQVIDVFGAVIPGFYCAGESAGGFALHGLGRCIGTGYIAGTHAAAERVRS